jgi:tetratricopeptide (TPR) repeat protein
MSERRGSISGSDEPTPTRTSQANAEIERIETAIARGYAEFDSKEGERRFHAGLARLHFDHAIGYIRRSGQVFGRLPELIGMGGRCLQRQQRLGEAVDRYRAAAREASRQKLWAQQLHWIGKEAEAHAQAEDTATAIALLEQAIESGRKRLRQHSREVASEFLKLLHRLAITTKDRERAKEVWREVFELAERAADPETRFRIAHNYAIDLVEQGHPRQAETYLEEALEIAGPAKISAAHVADALRLLSDIYREMRVHERGGDKLRSDLPLFDDPKIRHDLLSAAVDAYFAGSIWDKMREAAYELRNLRAEYGTQSGRADAAARYAIACRELGALNEAERALTDGIVDAKSAGDPEFELKLRAELGRVLAEQGRHEEAIAIYELVWQAGLRERLMATRYSKSLIAIGRLNDAEHIRDEFAEGDDDNPDVALINAWLADAGRGDPIDAWDARAHRAPVTEKSPALERLLELHPAGVPKRLDIARALARTAERLRSQVPDVFSERAWRAATPYADRLNGYLDAFLREAIAAGRHEEAIYELERFRSQALVDVMAERANVWAGERRQFGMKSVFADRAYRAHFRYEALAASGASWTARREAAEDADETDAHALTAERVMFMGPQVFGLHFPDTLEKHLEGIALGDGEVLVFARTTSTDTLLWFMGADHAIVQRSLTSFTLDDAARLYAGLWPSRARPRKVSDRVITDVARTRELGDPPADARIAHTLVELDRRLAGPIAVTLRELGATRAMLIGGTDLANLPIDQCPSVRRAGLDLGLLPTARALGFSRTPRFPQPETLYIPGARERRRFAKEVLAERAPRALIVVDPTKSLTYAVLEGWAATLAASERLEVEVLEGRQATQDEVTRRADHVGHLHLISHGLFDDASPYRSGMYTDATRTPASVWTVAEVFSEVAAPAGRLAVLSGCETGLLRTNVVSEEISLPAAFLAAGFASVIASRWAVDDLSTALLISEFYRRWLAGGVTVAAALRGTARWLRRLSADSTSEYMKRLASESASRLGPAVAKRVRQSARDAVHQLLARGGRPFSDPLHWAGFYVVGDPALAATTRPGSPKELTRSGTRSQSRAPSRKSGGKPVRERTQRPEHGTAKGSRTSSRRS